MTGGRCHRQRTMMGRGADGGCGTEEKPCPISRVLAKFSPEDEQFDEKVAPLGLDLYTQASKALSERSPFDTDEAQVSTVPTLPTELANLLNKNDNRKRHRKVHSGQSEKAQKNAIWAETEEYFRDFALDDVDKLQKLRSLGFLGSDKWFLIPKVGDVDPFLGSEECNFANKDVPIKEEMEVDSIEKEGTSSIKEENEHKRPFSGIEWLLGCKEKVHLTTERPSKKRKLLGGNAGLEKLFVPHPIKGSSSLCDYCGIGDISDPLNRLIVCHSCDVAVHERCYGVEEDINGSWLCNLCKSSYLGKNRDRPCVLCPKKGGALKPVNRGGTETESDGYTELAHLFCCQWVPEVYIRDTKTMEPVMNIEGIKDTRTKLVCNVCKVKVGACVRCSNGTCRTSFHPICAREAGYKMELWGKFGLDDVELRAYCSKHSDYHNCTNTQQLEQQVPATSCSDSQVNKQQSASPNAKKPNKLIIGRRNGDKAAVLLGTTVSGKPSNISFHEEGLSDKSNSRFQSCEEAQQPVRVSDRSTNDDVSTLDSLDYTMLLKKLIDRGKVNLKDVATNIGVSPDLLASISSDNHLAPDLRGKVVTWLRNNAHIGSVQRNLKVKIKSSLAPKDEKGVVVKDSNSSLVGSADVSANSGSPHRIKNKIKILKGNKVISPTDRETSDGLVVDVAKNEGVAVDADDDLRKECVSAITEKIFVDTDGGNEKPSSNNSLKHEEGSKEQVSALLEQNTTLNSIPKKSTCSILKSELTSTYFIHPVIHEKITKMQNSILSSLATYGINGSKEHEVNSPEVSSSLNELIEHLNSGDKISRFDESQLEQLADDKNIGLLKTSPGDEIEGELLFHQLRLLQNAVSTKRIADDMIFEVVKSVPQEIDITSKRKWDDVIVNQYMSVVKEAKKQGRKEKRHKEAQEVLSAATAAAAASSRISSLRKDSIDEFAHEENLMKANTSQHMPLAKDTNLSNARACDICKRPDTVLNPILVCTYCKVEVHLDCYHNVKDSIGPWYCEFCKDLLSRNSGDLAVNSWEKPLLDVECGLCGDSGGAFRKTIDGQWIHAFCAEWLMESTFKRGQANPIEGMESVVKGTECHICHRKQGACVKCNYGHCHSMFHPSCARSAGLYMNVKSSTGSKLQHKAYCNKHSMEQRSKVESQRHGVEELKSLKHVRVELERLRLLCERIIKREKLKRELVLCSQEVLVSNRDNAALSALVRSPFFPNDTSSESATTSLRGTTYECRSGSEATQRSDDVTVDSTVPGKRRVKFPLSKDNDRKTDESSMSSQLVMHKPRERLSNGGKQIPHRPPPPFDEKKSKARKA